MNPRAIRHIVTVALALLASGCAGEAYEYPEPSIEHADGAFVSTSSSIEVGNAECRADLGTLTVAENRKRAGSRLIHIPVLRIHSRSTSPREPIFLLAGGPGQSNMYWDWGSLRHLLADHDLVAVGYRGIDGSTVLDCPEVTHAMTGTGDLLCDQSMERIQQAWMTSARSLANRGVDLDGYSMPEVIEDNEAARTALKYDRINLMSGSYGTRIAYLYGLQHPDRIHASAMVSANPPGRLVWEPDISDRQLRRYATLWSRDSTMQERTGDLYGDMCAVLNAMPDNWLCIPIDPGKARVVTFALLFQRATASMVFDAYVAARHGDPSGLALMSVAYDYIFPSMMVWGDLAAKAVSADFDKTRDYRHDMGTREYPLGSPLGKLLWAPQGRDGWPVSLLPEEFRTARPSAVPTLILSGSNDFSTPAELATQELLPFLPNGTQVVFSECGHFNDILTIDPEYTKRLLGSFFASGVPDTSGNRYVPMDFHVRWGFPWIAKAAVGAFALIALALATVIVWIVRRGW